MLSLGAGIALALIGTVAGGSFVLGQLQPVATSQSPAVAAPMRPSYLVPVRPPTAAELEQRRALAAVRPSPRTITVAPREDIALATASSMPTTGPRARVVSDVNVRSGPGTDSAALSVAASGTEVTVLGQQGGWTEVTLSDGGSGWIASRFLAQ